MQVNLLDDKDINFEDKIDDLKVKNKNNIYIPGTNSYSHAITIVYKY